MRITVAIPAYNAAQTIECAIESVLAQSRAPEEILVMDDGSTDETGQVLRGFGSRLTVSRQTNQGAAHARNALVGAASGELIAFLDADDLWHPDYLETQHAMAMEYQEAVAYFTAHANFRGYGRHVWDEAAALKRTEYAIIEGRRFLEVYNRHQGIFGSMSFCCIPKKVLAQLGPAPFCVEVTGAEDFCLFNLLSLLGPVVLNAAPLAAYRIIEGSMSSDKTKTVGLAVRSFELLAGTRQEFSSAGNRRQFRTAFASKRRQYAKLLMGVGRVSEARSQLALSLKDAGSLLSLAKSAGLLMCTHIPAGLESLWPGAQRK